MIVDPSRGSARPTLGVELELELVMDRQNRWRAPRFGLGASLVDLRTSRPATVSDLVEAVVDRLRGVAEEASSRTVGGAGTVPVVGTPSRAEATVRVELPEGWAESLSDDDLLRALDEARGSGRSG